MNSPAWARRPDAIDGPDRSIGLDHIVQKQRRRLHLRIGALVGHHSPSIFFGSASLFRLYARSGRRGIRPGRLPGRFISGLRCSNTWSPQA